MMLVHGGLTSKLLLLPRQVQHEGTKMRLAGSHLWGCSKQTLSNDTALDAEPATVMHHVESVIDQMNDTVILKLSIGSFADFFKKLDMHFEHVKDKSGAAHGTRSEHFTQDQSAQGRLQSAKLSTSGRLAQMPDKPRTASQSALSKGVPSLSSAPSGHSVAAEGWFSDVLNFVVSRPPLTSCPDRSSKAPPHYAQSTSSCHAHRMRWPTM